MKFKEAVTYDDMLLVPQYSDIESRSEIDISNKMGHRTLTNSHHCLSYGHRVRGRDGSINVPSRGHGCSSSL